MESRKGNAITIGILYQTLCERLDIPVFAVNIPRQYILGFFDHYFEFLPTDEPEYPAPQFFIDPLQGQIYTDKDVETYLKRIQLESDPRFFRPLDNRRIIRLLLEELSKCYENDKTPHRFEELQSLADILKTD